MKIKYLWLLIWLQRLFLNRKTAEVGNKISEFTNVVTKAALNIKASKIEYKGLDTMGFVVTAESNRLT